MVFVIFPRVGGAGFEPLSPVGVPAGIAAEATSVVPPRSARRARRRVQGADMVRDADLSRQRDVVEAFLAATRGGDIEALLEVLDPDVVIRADHAAVPPGSSREIRGAAGVVELALNTVKRARFARPALVNGSVGLVVAPCGRLRLVAVFEVKDAKIVEIDVIADPERLRQLNLAVLED